MCAICGYLSAPGAKRPQPAVLSRMSQTMVHRGPDDQGLYAQGPVGLASQRLSIIDLATGHQPLSNEDESCWMVCNGEIYNFRDLRRQAEAAGHRFNTNTDVESILHLYEDLGPSCLNKLEGMFAVAIWDARNEILLLARDRMGKKPLYWAETPAGIVFASEIKGVLEWPNFQRKIDAEALLKYLSYGYIPAPRSIFQGVHKLPPAHYMLATPQGKRELSAYWKLSFSHKIAAGNEQEVEAHILGQLKLAVEKRLVSDVPLGVLLSGGVDSSLIASLARTLLGDRQLDAFTIGFEDPAYDESVYATRVARHLRLAHHVQVVNQEQVLAAIPTLADIMDEPMADPSIVPTYLLSRHASSHVKVALSGDGGDELFGGYPKYVAHRFAAWWDRIPSALTRPLEASALATARSLPESVLNARRKRLIMGLPYSPDLRNQIWIAPFLPHELQAVVSNEVLSQGAQGEEPFSEVPAYSQSFDGTDLVDRMLYLDSRLTLQDAYLTKMDRASMAASLEVRSPFLDSSVVELAASLPSHLKVRGLTTKYILKKVAAAVLPREVVHRRKQGFGVPLPQWFRGELAPLLTQNLASKRIAEEGFFVPAAIDKLVAEHTQGRCDHSQKLWTLLVFQMWLKRWGQLDAG